MAYIANILFIKLDVYPITPHADVIKKVLPYLNKDNINSKIEGGWTFLEHACFSVDVETVKKMLEIGADPNKYNSDNIRDIVEDVVYNAINCNYDSSNTRAKDQYIQKSYQVAKLLLDHGARIQPSIFRTLEKQHELTKSEQQKFYDLLGKYKNTNTASDVYIE